MEFRKGLNFLAQNCNIGLEKTQKEVMEVEMLIS